MIDITTILRATLRQQNSPQAILQAADLALLQERGRPYAR
jgi:hypothetical protein